MSTPPTPPIPEAAVQEKITLEITTSNLLPQSQKDLAANATLQRISKPELLAKLLQKKLGNVFTVRAA